MYIWLGFLGFSIASLNYKRLYMKSTTTVRRHLTWRHMCRARVRDNEVHVPPVGPGPAYQIIPSNRFWMTRWDWVTTINRVTWVQANWNGKHKHKHHSVTALECSRACSQVGSCQKIVDSNRRWETDEVRDGDEANRWQREESRQQVERAESVTELSDRIVWICMQQND